jgi:hypothetical protein
MPWARFLWMDSRISFMIRTTSTPALSLKPPAILAHVVARSLLIKRA